MLWFPFGLCAPILNSGKNQNFPQKNSFIFIWQSLIAYKVETDIPYFHVDSFEKPQICKIAPCLYPTNLRWKILEWLPLRHRLSSFSSHWIVFLRVLFFSFSFSYFFFHCSAVNSTFTQTVFLIVLALRYNWKKKKDVTKTINHQYFYAICVYIVKS